MTTNLSYEHRHSQCHRHQVLDEVKTILGSATGAELMMPWEHQVGYISMIEW